VIVPTASGAIRFAKIYYDSPGSDTGSNRSLNNEWVCLFDRDLSALGTGLSRSWRRGWKRA
jgi:hypothetical protein